jgi:hypothetical protein
LGQEMTDVGPLKMWDREVCIPFRCAVLTHGSECSD